MTEAFYSLIYNLLSHTYSVIAIGHSHWQIIFCVVGLGKIWT